MWNRKKEEDLPVRSTYQQPSSADLTRDGVPMTTLPPRPDPESGRSAVIGKAVVVKGQVFSREDLFLDGEVEGSIEMPESRLTVGPNGRVRAGIKARELVVLGTINGNVDIGDKTDIRREAKLVGDIKTVRITIEDGAYFKGSIDIVRPDAKPDAKSAGKATAAPATMAAAAGDGKA
jgi:cytoskeletal protein CcmA (bactofilin family)